jgi:hypothetical protein
MSLSSKLRRFIHLTLIIYVLTSLILLLELIAIPIMRRMGLPSIEPKILTSTYYYFVRIFLIILCAVFTVVYLLIYFIWLIIKKVVPTIFGLRKKVLSFPPFPQLDRAGIFRLFNAIFGNIASIALPTTKLKNISKEIARFFYNNRDLIREAASPFATGIIATVNPVKGEYAGKDEATNNKRPKPREDTLNDVEKRTIDDLEQQCLEENTELVSPDMGQVEKQKIRLNNIKNKNICKIKSLQNTVNLLSFKM